MTLRASQAAVALLLAACSTPPSGEKKAESTPAPAVFTPDPATAAKITGRVRLTGRAPAPKAIVMDSDEDCQKLHSGRVLNQDIVVGAGGAVTNVFVYVKTGLEGKTFAAPKETVRLDQKGCMFRPRVIGLMTAQTLEVSNSDSVSHNVHPLPRFNREWNQGQTAGAAPLLREFDKPETMIPVKCNVHAWMRSYIGVLPHPYFSVTGADGAFELKGLPPGSYTVEAWHERFGVVEQKITLAPSSAETLDFTLKGE